MTTLLHAKQELHYTTASLFLRLLVPPQCVCFGQSLGPSIHPVLCCLRVLGFFKHRCSKQISTIYASLWIKIKMGPIILIVQIVTNSFLLCFFTSYYCYSHELWDFSPMLKYFLYNWKASPLSNVHNGDVYHIMMAVAWIILNFVPLFEVYSTSCQ